MLNHIIRFSVRNKLIIGLLVLGLVGMGIYDFTRLPIDAVPDITNNQVQVITVSPSLAAPEVERLITFPIEQSVASIPGIIEMRSFSRFGLSLVTIVFSDATDVYWARMQVNEKLSVIKDQIPADAGQPQLAPVTTGLGEIFQYAVRAKEGYEGKYGPTELRTIQDWMIRRQLLGTQGVADVSSFGGYLKQYEVAILPDKLKSLGVSVRELYEALQKNNQNTGGAYIERGPSILYIRTEGLVKTLDQIGGIFVKHTTAGIPVYVKDVANVRIGHAVRYGAMCFNDRGEVAGAVVMMLKGANSSEVVRQIKEKIKVIEKTLPEGVVIEPFLDRTKMVNNTIGTVKRNLLEGALIVIFILVLFLGNIRAGLIVASVIPLAMLFAVSMMNVFGVSGNLMSLGALDFGLIVDGAVIIVEAVMHRLYHSRHFATVNAITQEEMNHEVEGASGKMMNSAVFGQIIILIVYLPILSLVGIEGKMFKPMAQTVSFALIGAFILSLTYVPMMTSLVLSKRLSHTDTWADKMMRFLESVYQPALDLALRFPKLLVGFAFGAFLLAVWVLTRLGGEFIPKLEEGDFAVDTRLLTGSSLTKSIETTQKTSAMLLRKFPEVEKIVTKIGSGEIPTDPMPVEASDMMVILKDKSEWKSATSFDELADKMIKELEQFPEVTVGFQFPVQMRFNELMTGARQDIVCKIFGEDLDTLSAYAHRLGSVINTVQGATDLYVETVTGLPQIVIQYDKEALARHKVSVEEVNHVIETAFAGMSAGMIYENERRFDLVVRLEQQARGDINDVRQLLISTPSGLQIPLEQLAQIEIREGPNQIQREEAKRRIVVGFNVRGSDVQTIVNELSQKVSSQLRLSPGYYITYGGQFENLVEAKKRLSVAVPVALLLIFIMLYFAFGKLKYGLLIFSAIPLSAIGGVLALWLRGMPFSISAGIGFIALFGVAVLNGIVLIAEFNRLKEQGLHDLKQLVMEGTKVRLRPVLMTAMVASLGFLPMALSSGAGAEVQRPLATVVIGGLITATLLTLLLLPVLYQWFERERKPGKSRSKELGLIIGALILAGTTCAQDFPPGKAMSLPDMLVAAERNNTLLQITREETGYWNALQQKVFETPPTMLGAEYGSFNSIFKDNRFFLSQTLYMPVVYKRQKSFYEARWSQSKAGVQVKAGELRRQVRYLFYQMVDLMERQKLLRQLDTIYTNALQAAALRYKTGESKLLDRTNAEAQLQQLRLQEQQIQTDMKVWQEELKWLLHSTETIYPWYTAVKAGPEGIIDSLSIAEHPLVLFQQQQEHVATTQKEVDRSRLQPEWILGYNNLSIRGWQSSDGITQKYYGASQRFSAFNLSLGIPLFNQATKSRIRAGEVQEKVARQQTASTGFWLANQRRQAQEQYLQQEQQVDYYEKFGLDYAAEIIRNAGISFSQGEISYLEWSVLLQNAIQIKTGYLESIRRRNNYIIELEYLNGK